MDLATLRVVIVAPDALTRAGLASVLSAAGVNVVGQVATDDDTRHAFSVFHPDVLLWDIGWDAETGLEQLSASLLVEAGLPELPVVVLLPLADAAPAVWQAGVRALQLRSNSPAQLAAALLAAAERLVVFDPQLIAAIGADSLGAGEPLAEPLSPRELEVLQLLGQGLPNKAIARQLHISEHTVKFHVNAILTKLGAQSRTDAVVRASRAGLILL